MYNNDLVRLVRDNATDQARTWVRGNHAVRVAEELARMDPSDRAVAFRLLDKDKAMSVFELLDAEPVLEPRGDLGRDFIQQAHPISRGHRREQLVNPLVPQPVDQGALVLSIE